MTLRLGRQELQYGSGRLLDVREGPSLRLYFDGAKVAYASLHYHGILADQQVYELQYRCAVFQNRRFYQ